MADTDVIGVDAEVLPAEVEGVIADMAAKEVRSYIEELVRKRISAYLAENAETIKEDVKLALDEKITAQVQVAIAAALPGTIEEVVTDSLSKKWG